MGDVKAINVVSDVMSLTPFTGFGMIDIAKGRLNVPFSGAHMGNLARSVSNLTTGEQMRGEVADTFGTPLAKQIETGVGAAALTAITLGAGGAFAGAGEAGAAAAGEGTAAAGEGLASSAGSSAALEAGGVAPTAAASAPDLAALGESGAVTSTGSIPVSQGALASATPADIAGVGLQSGGEIGPVASAPTMTGSLVPDAPTVVPGTESTLNSANGTLTQGATKAPYASMNEGAKGWGIIEKAPETAAGMKNWFQQLDPIAQGAVLYGGTQLLAGAAQGSFAGMSEQKKIALATLINEQNQTQRQRLNTQNSYAPSLKFNPHPATLPNTGVLTTGPK